MSCAHPLLHAARSCACFDLHGNIVHPKLRPRANVLHSKDNPNWMTPVGDEDPQRIVARARDLLGGTIQLDPWSCAQANARIKAVDYFDGCPGADGFTMSWFDRTFFANVVGGRVAEGWRKMVTEVERRARGVWLGFSVEQLCILADPRPAVWPSDYSMCILRRRVSFVDDRTGLQGSPSHGNYVVAPGVSHAAFERLFGELGAVTRGPLSRD